MRAVFRVGPAPRKRHLCHRQKRDDLHKTPISVAKAARKETIVELARDQDDADTHGAPIAQDLAATTRVKDLLRTTPPSLGCAVPYDSYSVYPDPHIWGPEMCQAMEFYLREVMPTLGPVYTIMGVYNIYESHLTRKWSPMIFQGTMTSVVLTMVKVIPEHALWLRYYPNHGKVLSNLRKKVSYAIGHSVAADEELIESMVILVNLTIVLGQQDIAELHLVKLRQLLAMRKSQLSPELSYHVACLCKQWESNWANVRPNYPLMFRPTLAMLPPPSEESLTTFNNKLVPVGFRRLVENDRLSRPLVKILDNMTTFLLNAALPPNKRVTPYIPAEHMDFAYACPSLDSEIMTFDKLLCLTVMILCNVLFRTNYSAFDYLLTFKGRRHLVSTSITSFYTEDICEQACLPWIWMVAVESYRTNSNSYDSAGMVLLADFQDRYPSLKWSSLEPKMFDFFWTNTLSAHIRAVWPSAKCLN